MTGIEMLVPKASLLGADELSERLDTLKCTGRFAPFDAALMKLAGDFSRRLLDDRTARDFPELQVLGFWLRPAALETMKKDFMPKPGAVAVPQGLVFHLPPASVETIFAYSLFVSLLCGNANVILLPSRRGAVTMFLVRLLADVLKAASEPLRNSLLILGYEHDPAITETISQVCDLRVIWGGDVAVNAIRTIPLAPFGRELIFPDRFSWSAIKSDAYRSFDDAARQNLAERYFNDLFWFDQQGCSSPRIVLWCGNIEGKLTDDFYRRVAQIAETKKWRLDTGSSLSRQTRNYGTMIDSLVTGKRDFGTALTVFSLADLRTLTAMRKNPCFGGTLLEFCIDELSDIAAFIERRDQTLSHFGFTRNEAESFVRKLNGKGFDRLVPIGEALAFEPVWDGYDLPANFTRLVTVKL